MSNDNPNARPASLAATRSVIAAKFGEIRPDNVATILHTIANDWAKVAVASVTSAPDRFHALVGCAEMVTALALALDEAADAEAAAHAAWALATSKPIPYDPRDRAALAAEGVKCYCGHQAVGYVQEWGHNPRPACPMHVGPDYYADAPDDLSDLGGAIADLGDAIGDLS